MDFTYWQEITHFKGLKKMNIELARGEQALVRLRRIERPTSNFEWEKGRTSDG